MSEVTLWGLRQQVFGGYNCLRGYASMQDLLEIAEAKNYQRELIDEHVAEISKFYEDDKYLFFPEIILACEIDDLSFLLSMQQNYAATLYSNGVKYRYYKSNKFSELKIDNEKIKLHIIDGNHRLNAFVKTPFDETKQVPFCILFLLKGQEDKHAKIIFNNINYKNKSLRQEDNLKNIFEEESESYFSDDEIDDEFGSNYTTAKYVIQNLEKNHLEHTYQNLIDKYYREGCFKAVNILNKLIKDKKQLTVENTYKAIEDTLNLQNEKIDLGLFLAYVYYKFIDNININNQKYNLFDNWIRKNNINKIKDICCEDVINIFNNILERKKRQIFVSMPFNQRNCDNIFDAIVRVTDKISKKYHIDAPLVLRIDEIQQSSTFKIIEKIENAIEDTGYLIAILNHCNPNVYHEIGYAMGYFKGKGLNSNVLLVLEEPEDSEKLNTGQYKVGFNLQGYKQLRFKRLNDFERDLEQKLLLHYELK